MGIIIFFLLLLVRLIVIYPRIDLSFRQFLFQRRLIL
jgi:hypothetical protein